MQLGTRWSVGQPPPASVPARLHAAIAATEAESGATRGSWTLTWLEGRPIAELDAGWEVLVDSSGEVVARRFHE